MGFLSTLGKIAKPLGAIGAVAAAPFTAGTSMAALPAILGGVSAVGGALGNGAASAQAGRMNDAEMQARMNAGNNNAQLQAANFNLGAPAARLGQVARADVLSGMKDAGPTGDPRIDKFGGGGLRPSAFGADSRKGADEMKRQALMAMMTGSDKVTPQISSIPKAGLLEKIGGVAGLAGGLAGIAGQAGIGGPKLKIPQIAQMGDVDPYQLPGFERV